jgi:EmrB/QacA subfamily drug resistance transporter
MYVEISADVVGAGSSPQVQVGAGSARRWALALGSFTSFLVGLDTLVVATALPTLHQEYGGGVEVLGWTVDAYQLAFAASILTGATLGDRFGRRRMFVCGVLVFTAASALCALSPTVEVLLAARVAQGIGGGLAVPLSVALIIDAVPPQERGRALGLWGAVTGVAVAAGPVIGGAVVEGLAWQWIFWLNVPIGALLAVLAWWKIHESTRSFTSRVDLVGVVLATAGVFAIAQALIRGESAGWTSASVAGGLVGGALILAGFVAWERRTRRPMMPMAMFASRGLAAGCVTGFGLMAGVFGFGFLTAQYLQLGLGYSPLGVGLRMLPATGMALAVSPLAGRLADRVGDRSLVTLGLGLQAVGLLLLGVVVTPDSGYGTVIGPLLLTGIGIAVAFPTIASAVMRSVPLTHTAIASGVSNTFRQVGAVFGVALAAAVFATAGSYRTPGELVDGLRPAFVALSVVCAVCATLGVLIWRSDRTTTQAQTTQSAPEPNTG